MSAITDKEAMPREFNFNPILKKRVQIRSVTRLTCKEKTTYTLWNLTRHVYLPVIKPNLTWVLRPGMHIRTHCEH